MKALKEQLRILTVSMTTLTQEKNRIESQFLADNKQLRVRYFFIFSVFRCANFGSVPLDMLNMPSLTTVFLNMCWANFQLF